MKTIVPGLLVVLALAVTAHGEAVTREYPVPGHGALALMMPANWVGHVREGEQGAPPTIELSDPDGNVKVLITPLWSPTGDASFNSPDAIREGIARAAELSRKTAVEPELPLHELAARMGRGYYFWATDRAPKPGEYEYLANGAVPAGPLLVSFTILSHAAPPKGIATALIVVSTSRQLSTSW
jgi:hypothetical protein